MFKDLIGVVLGERYEIQNLLGSGGMAWVFVAYDRTLERKVAVKIVKPALVLSTEMPDIADRFIKEAHIVANLRHDHILRVYDQGKQLVDGQTLIYLVMQLANRGTLAERIMEKGALTPCEAGSVLKQVCDALDYAHSRRVLHLDLKPDNILFDERGDALVADFGLAKLLRGASRVKADTGFGTPIYMPPEQYFGYKAGPFSDVYALGVTLYQMLVGELPEPDWSDASLRLRLDHPLPSGVRAVIARATQSDWSKRYQVAGDLGRAFMAAIALEKPEEAPPLRRLSASRVGIGLAALLIMVSLVVFGARWPWWDRLAEATSTVPSTTTTPMTPPLSTPEPTTSPMTTQTLTPSPTPYLPVGVERLRVYAGPGEIYGILGEVRRGDQLPLRGRSEDGMWWQVDYLGWKGWIRAQPNIDATILPMVKAPPTPMTTPTPTPTETATPSPPEPNTLLPLQNPGFERVRDDFIPGWHWWAADNYSPGGDDDPSISFDTPFFSQTNDPARMIDGPTLQIEATAFVKFKVHIFQIVSVSSTVTVRFQALAKAYSDLGGIKLAAGIDPSGGPNCSQVRWGEMLTIDQSSDTVELVAPDATVGDARRVTVCLYAETLYPARSNAAFFDNAALIANPE